MDDQLEARILDRLRGAQRDAQAAGGDLTLDDIARIAAAMAHTPASLPPKRIPDCHIGHVAR